MTEKSKISKTAQGGRWTNESVLALCSSDPARRIRELARQVVIDAVDQGWRGPPYDPFELAQIRGVEVTANHAISDARLVPGRRKVEIEFNPQPPA